LLGGELPEPLLADDQSTTLHGGRVEGPLIAGNLEVLLPVHRGTQSTLGRTDFPPSLGAKRGHP
jgi:hypothetical protein